MGCQDCLQVQQSINQKGRVLGQCLEVEVGNRVVHPVQSCPRKYQVCFVQGLSGKDQQAEMILRPLRVFISDIRSLLGAGSLDWVFFLLVTKSGIDEELVVVTMTIIIL